MFIATISVSAAMLSGCKDDVEPGTESSSVTGLYINEVCSGGEGGDWIEIFNSTDESLDISGYHVQDNKGTDEEYTFPAGSSVEAGGFVVIEEGTFEFGISGSGDSITLLDEAYAVIDAVQVPAMDDNYTYSRTEDGGSSWETVAGGTKGRSNSGEADEIPDPSVPEVPEGENYDGIRLNELNGNDKFIELYNASDADVDISGCQIMKDDEKTIFTAEGVTISAGDFLTIWSEDVADEAPSDALIFSSGLSADKSVKIELLDPDGNSLDVFKNLSVASGEKWGEDDGKYDSKDKETKPSFARETDGTGDWYIMLPTQGKTNAGASKIGDEKIEW